MSDEKADQGVPRLVAELWELVLAYFRQEAVAPFRGLLRFVGFGVAGAMTVSLGVVLLLAGILRLLQSQTGSVFQGNLTPLPYVITLATGLLVLAVAARAIVSGRASRAGS